MTLDFSYWLMAELSTQLSETMTLPPLWYTFVVCCPQVYSQFFQAETQAYDDAFMAAYSFAEKHGNTLVIRYGLANRYLS